MLVADTYPDYDGYSIYTAKAAAAKPQPRWPEQDANLMSEVRCPALPLGQGDNELGCGVAVPTTQGCTDATELAINAMCIAVTFNDANASISQSLQWLTASRVPAMTFSLHTWQIRGRKEFMCWSAMMECTARRAMEVAAIAGPKPWVRGWDATLSLINANVKALSVGAAQTMQ